MSVAIITGSAGLIGSEAALFFAERQLQIVGIDNNMRRVFFGDDASNEDNLARLRSSLGGRYVHHDVDIRDREGINRIFARYGSEIKTVIHTASQPSHDWAVRDPLTDFSVNATGTAILLDATRAHAPDAVFIFTSTNKVYGDTPNRLPLVEMETRWELDPSHTYYDGVREDMSIDATLHSLFGASKVAADVLVQEYGRYFGMRTACFRGGCLTGPNHSGTQLHGFLAYLMKCTVTGTPYTVYGYKGKQVRDNIHSYDLIAAFDAFFRNPRSAEIYNVGGGRASNCSMIEAIALCEQIAERPLRHTYSPQNRIGDHQWWVSSNARFESHFPQWKLKYGMEEIAREIYEKNVDRWSAGIRSGAGAV